MKNTEFHLSWVFGSRFKGPGTKKKADAGGETSGSSLDTSKERLSMLNMNAPGLSYFWCHDTCRF